MTQKRSCPSPLPPIASRSSPSTRAATFASSATMKSVSPSRAPSAAAAACISSGFRNLAIGERQPSASTTAQTSPFAPSALGLLGQVVEALAREVAARLEAAHDPAGLERAAEHLELGALERVREVGDLHADPAVRLVGAVAQHHVVVLEPLERRLHLDSRRGEDRGDHAVDERDHVLLLDERELHVELGELGLAVRAQVLVPEAARDLVVALEAADHQDLLEELRRLRQRVPRAALESARHEEVACALGRRAGHHRRLDLEEALLVQVVAYAGDHVVAKLEVPAHVLAAEVEVAVLEPQLLVRLLAALLDLERRRVRVREQIDLARDQLDLPGRQVGVDGALLARD